MGLPWVVEVVQYYVVNFEVCIHRYNIDILFAVAVVCIGPIMRDEVSQTVSETSFLRLNKTAPKRT